MKIKKIKAEKEAESENLKQMSEIYEIAKVNMH